LRSGAFAPDFPFVIFVRLRLPSDSLGRIEVARPACHRREGLRASGFVALLDLWSGHEIYRVAKPRPRGRPRLALRCWNVLRRRFALLETGFLMARHVGGGAVMGGAAKSCLRMLTVSRAAHRALHIHVERHGIRAATGQQHCWCHQLRSHTRATPWRH